MDEKAPTHELARLNSSASVSDFSEVLSDMSLSTSPGSGDMVGQDPVKNHSEVAQTHHSLSQHSLPRKRLVVRQMSSNPYLASAEMSPDDHPLIVGSHSFAAGESRLYQGSEDVFSSGDQNRSNSYPLTSDCVEETDEEELDEQEEEEEEDVEQRPEEHLNNVSGDNGCAALGWSRGCEEQVITPVCGAQSQYSHHHHSHHHHHHFYHSPYHNSHRLSAQHHHHRHHLHHQSDNKNSKLEKSQCGYHDKQLGYNHATNQNISASANSYPLHKQCPTQPRTQEINAWGQFYRPHQEAWYKYRRSHYSSDSDEETGPPATSRAAQYRMRQLSSPPQHQDNNGNTSCVRVPQPGMKPSEFRDRLQVMKRWFSESNHSQKNLILKGLLSVCELPQLHLLSVHMSKELHHGCPSNCEDIITWLPSDLATKVMSYLDPVSLCQASQVCKVWHQLADDQTLWRRFCCQTKWRLSRAAEHKQVISHMCQEGCIQWKNVFAERFRLRNNWLRGRCTVRTFEGHLQGISCVQFDDSRIVSGSSDKTIKVWNMRTNAPWSVQTLMGHHGTVRCLHLEGNRLVSGSCDTTIKVWDLSTQESWSSIACKVTMTGHSDTVRCLQADDDKVISGSYDKTLKIWDLKSGELRQTLRGHEASVLCVHFSDTKIVSGSADKTIKVWNYEGCCITTLSGHQDAVTCLMFDSTRIVSGSLDHNLKFWDIHSGQCLNTIDWKKAEGHTDVVRCLQADSWRVVSAADDRTIKVWNLETGERIVTLRNHTDGVTCLQFNDFIIVSGSYDKTVKLWDFSSC